MESLLAVEKEIDKALEVFEVFYDEIDNEIDKVMEKISLNSNEISTSKYKIKSAHIFAFKQFYLVYF